MNAVTAIIEQISSQLMYWMAMLAVADVTTKILVGLCAVLVLLLLMIARTFMGAGTSAPEPAFAPTLELTAEQIGDTGRRAEPVMETQKPQINAQPDHDAHPQPVEFDAIRTAQMASEMPAPDNDTASSGSTAEDTGARLRTIEDDFKIFRRPASASQPAPRRAPEMDEDNELAIIEKNMIRLKELFHEGHITRDVYVDETRTLYHQAKSILGSG